MKTLIIILQNLPTILTCIKELVYALKKNKETSSEDANP